MKLDISNKIEKYFYKFFKDFVYLYFDKNNKARLDLISCIEDYHTDKVDTIIKRNWGVCFDSYNIMSSYLIEHGIRYDSYLLIPNNVNYIFHPIIVIDNKIYNYGVPDILNNKINENKNKIIPFDTFKNSYTYYKLNNDNIFREPNVLYKQLKESLYKIIGL